MDRLLREANPPTGQLASPKPQYKKPGEDAYEPVEGQYGAPFATLKDASGNVVSPATDAKLEQVKSELELVKSELQTIKANQLSGDQKVQLSGNIVEHTIINAQSVAPGGNTTAINAGEYIDGTETAVWLAVLSSQPWTWVRLPNVFGMLLSGDQWVYPHKTTGIAPASVYRPFLCLGLPLGLGSEQTLANWADAKAACVVPTRGLIVARNEGTEVATITIKLIREW